MVTLGHMSKEVRFPLFDQFLVVSLKNGVYAGMGTHKLNTSSDVSRENYVPYVKEIWPPSSSTTPNVGLFCFPEDIDANAIIEIKKYVLCAWA